MIAKKEEKLNELIKFCSSKNRALPIKWYEIEEIIQLNKLPRHCYHHYCCYVLAFSLIMLQTDLHSTQIKNKMTVDEFVSNNRGINNGKDLPKAYLTALYNNINAKPITLNEDED